MEKPDVDRIDNLTPAIAVEQRVTSRSSRSTVGTVTEIHDHLKLMWARIGKTYSPDFWRRGQTGYGDRCGGCRWEGQGGPAVYGVCPRSPSRRPLTEGSTRHLAAAGLCAASRRRSPRFPCGHGCRSHRGYACPRCAGADHRPPCGARSRCGWRRIQPKAGGLRGHRLL